MNRTNLMQDPFYARILYMIESRIGSIDRQARAQNLALTDSQIRSILNKVRKRAGGGMPQVPACSEREQLLASLYEELVRARNEIQVETSGAQTEVLPLQDWVASLRTVEDSIQLRTGGAGSRNYLDYLDGFLIKAKK